MFKKSPIAVIKKLMLPERRIQDTTLNLWFEIEPQLWDKKTHGA